VTGDIDQQYLDFLDGLRNDDAKTQREIQQDLANLELHNEGA
jgi:amidophosphoribosyltransferase